MRRLSRKVAHVSYSQQIAFIDTDGEDNEIFIANADGSDPTQATYNSVPDFRGLPDYRMARLASRSPSNGKQLAH